jgi:hypothetical protein
MRKFAPAIFVLCLLLANCYSSRAPQSTANNASPQPQPQPTPAQPTNNTANTIGLYIPGRPYDSVPFSPCGNCAIAIKANQGLSATEWYAGAPTSTTEQQCTAYRTDKSDWSACLDQQKNLLGFELKDKELVWLVKFKAYKLEADKPYLFQVIRDPGKFAETLHQFYFKKTATGEILYSPLLGSADL